MTTDRFAVGTTSGWSIPDEVFEVECVVHDRADGSAVVASYVAAGNVRGRGFRHRVRFVECCARRLAQELNARDRGEVFDRFVVCDAPRFHRIDKDW